MIYLQLFLTFLKIGAFTFGGGYAMIALIREEVEKVATPQGGLTMIYGLYPGVPLENVKALMDAMEKYSFYFS